MMSEEEIEDFNFQKYVKQQVVIKKSGSVV